MRDVWGYNLTTVYDSAVFVIDRVFSFPVDSIISKGSFDFYIFFSFRFHTFTFLFIYGVA